MRRLHPLTTSRTVRRAAAVTATGIFASMAAVLAVAAPASAAVRGPHHVHRAHPVAHRKQQPAKHKGWAVHRPHRRLADPALGQWAVKIASHQRGKPYVWGAAGPHSFDCSGLVKYVYGKLGVRLPHHAAWQYPLTRHLSHAAARPGDLVFFAFAGGGPRAIDHVGIFAGHHSMWVARHPGTRITREFIWTNRYWIGRVR